MRIFEMKNSSQITLRRSESLHSRSSELHVQSFENSLSDAFRSHYDCQTVIAQLLQILTTIRLLTHIMEQFAIEEQPRAAHQPRNRSATSVVHQQRHFHTLHEHRRYLNDSGRHVDLEITKTLSTSHPTHSHAEITKQPTFKS